MSNKSRRKASQSAGDSQEQPPAEPTAEEIVAAAAKRAKAETIGRYVAMFFMPLIMVGMMISGYLGTMHAPAPNNMPIAVVGNSAPADAFAAAVETATPDAVDLQMVDSAATARDMVMNREVTAAVSIVDGKATVITASAAGSTQASTVTAVLVPQVLAEGMTFESEDLVPLPKKDAAGLGAMFMATALVMAGYLPFSMTLSNSPELLRFRRAVPLLAGWSALVAGLVWLVTGPILGMIDNSNAAGVLGIAWLGVFAIGSVQLLLTRFLGPMAVIVGMFLLMVLGIPASNMSFSVYTMPSFFTVLHGFLPTPAIGEALRSLLYFQDGDVWSHLLVLIIGAVVALALTLFVDISRRRRNPDHSGPKANIASLHGGPRPRTKFWRYFSLLMFPLVMVGMMISIMLGAMHSPMPKDMPVTIVGATVEQAQQAVDGIEQNMPGMFDLLATDSADEARTQVQDRTATAAFILPSAEAPAATLVTNQAAGTSAQMVVKGIFGQVAAGQQLELQTEELAPLHSNDTMGTVSMYLTMGWILSGFMIIIVGANAQPKSRPLKMLLPIVAGWSVFMSAVLYLIAGPFTGSVDGHFWPLFGVGIVAIFCVAMFSAVLERLIGMFSILPIVGLLIMLGVPSSGGALSVFMEPEIFRTLHNIMPMAAGVESVRSILYFGGDVVGHHLLTFAIWGAVSLVLLLIIDKIKPPRTESHPIEDDDVEAAVATEPAKELASV